MDPYENDKSKELLLPPPEVDVTCDDSSKEIHPEQDKLVVLCLPLYKYGHDRQFAICVVGVLVFFLFNGYCLELIFQLPGFRTYGMFLTFIQFVVNSVMAFWERRLREDSPRRIPLKVHCLIGFLSVSTIGLSNTSVGYLNYPTHVIFKCCTLIPVLLGSVLIQGKKHGLYEVFAAIFMSVGLICFMLTDSKVSPNFNTTGVTLILLALSADAAIGNVQEKAMSTYSASILEVIYYSNIIGSIYLFGLLIALNQLVPAITFCHENPMKTYGYGSLFSVSGYCGLQLILALLRISGSFTTALVANCRKGLTVIISFLAFEKPFSQQYIWSGLLVFIGIFFNMLGSKPDLRKRIYERLCTGTKSENLQASEDLLHIKSVPVSS